MVAASQLFFEYLTNFVFDLIRHCSQPIIRRRAQKLSILPIDRRYEKERRRDAYLSFAKQRHKFADGVGILRNAQRVSAGLATR